MQGISRTLIEELKWGPSGIQSRDWVTYPVVRFNAMPKFDYQIINRTDQRVLGAGEVVGSRHARLRPEAAGFRENAVVVGGDDHARKVSRHGNTLVDVLQHGLGADTGESFSREPRGGVTRGDNTQDFALHRR